MSEVYVPGEFQAGYPDGIERNFWNIARNAVLQRLVRPLVNDQDLIMDVGCGPGIFLSSLADTSLRARGVEQGEPTLLPGLDALIDTGTDLFDLDPSLLSQIRVVLLLDVIEHMVDRRSFLQRIFAELPQCHHLVVTVPARQEVWTTFDQDWGHQLRYDRPTLRAELVAAGFAPQTLAYHFQWVYVTMLAMKALGVQRGSDFRSPTRNPWVANVHRTLGAVTRLESRLVPGFLPGSSLICVASRND